MKQYLSLLLESKHQGQSGQIAVVILLVVVVMATVGLSELSQTTEDLFTSSQKEEATRVFNAAETGVEEALSNEGRFTNNPDGFTSEEGENDEINVDVDIEPESTLETSLAEGDTATVNLTGTPNNTTVTVRFGPDASCSTGSIMVAVYSTNTGVRYDYIRPNNCTNDTHAGRNNDTFQAAGGAQNGYANTYSFQTSLGDNLLRITPLYAPITLQVVGTSSSVAQSHTVRSTAGTDVSEMEGAENTIEQIIEVQRSLPAAPSYMNYVLYSNGAIQHN